MLNAGWGFSRLALRTATAEYLRGHAAHRRDGQAERPFNAEGVPSFSLGLIALGDLPQELVGSLSRNPEGIGSADATPSEFRFQIECLPRVDRCAINPRLHDGTPSAFGVTGESTAIRWNGGVTRAALQPAASGRG